VLDTFLKVEGINDFNIRFHDGRWCLEMPVDKRDETARECYVRAEKILLKVNNVARIDYAFGAVPVEMNRWCHQVVDDQITGTQGIMPSAKGYVSATPKPDVPLRDLLVHFQDDAKVQEAALFLNSNQYLGVNLYKVWEIINDDVSMSDWTNLEWVNEYDDIQNFVRSMHFERHWKVNNKPKVRISHEQGYFFIAHVFHMWLNGKSKNEGSLHQ
jgi:hypothetical protein